MLRHGLRTLIAAVRFLTRLPMPGPETRAEDLPGSIAWFPLVGALVGSAIGGVAVGLLPYWSPLVAVVLAVGAGLLLTGGFHEDAASDAADGLGGGFTTEKVLLIMRDSRIGAYGAMSLWLVLTLRSALLWLLLDRFAAGTIPAWQVPVTYALACAWGRWSAAPLLLLPPLSEGLAQQISQHPTKDISQGRSHAPLIQASALLLLACGIAHWLTLPQVLPAAAIGLLTCGLWALYLWRRLKGQSGDLLGAGNQVVELAVLLALTA